MREVKPLRPHNVLLAMEFFFESFQLTGREDGSVSFSFAVCSKLPVLGRTKIVI